MSEWRGRNVRGFLRLQHFSESDGQLCRAVIWAKQLCDVPLSNMTRVQPVADDRGLKEKRCGQTQNMKQMSDASGGLLSWTTTVLERDYSGQRKFGRRPLRRGKPHNKHGMCIVSWPAVHLTGSSPETDQ